MERWGADLYGDPCRTCGFHWDLAPRQAVTMVGEAPARFWSARAWVEAVNEALATHVVLQHANRGPQRAEDVARSNAHDAHHHLHDIGRILG